MIFHDPSGVIICILCSQTSFKTMNSLRAHAKDKHGFRGTIGTEFVNEIIRTSRVLSTASESASRTTDIISKNNFGNGTSNKKKILLRPMLLPKCLDGEWLTVGQNRYWDAPKSLKEKNRRLESIAHLPVYDGLQCPEPSCLYCCTNEIVFRRHLRSVHPASSSAAPRHLKVQRLSEGSTCRYFPVTVPPVSTNSSLPASTKRAYIRTGVSQGFGQPKPTITRRESPHNSSLRHVRFSSPIRTALDMDSESAPTDDTMSTDHDGNGV